MRLIDADAFVKWIERQKRLAKITTIMAIQETHAIDAVPVVRCKDCKHWDGFALGSDKGACIENACIMYDVDFCSYGVKRNEQ